MGNLKPPFPQLQRGSRLANGLIGAWTVTDGSGTKIRNVAGSNYDAAISGSPVWTGGPIGGALQFASGTSDHAVASNFPALPSPFTFVCSFRLTGAPGAGVEWDFISKANAKRLVGVINQGSGARFLGYNGANAPVGTTTLLAGVSYVGIGTNDSAGLRIYLNGKFEGSVANAAASDTVSDLWLNGLSGFGRYGNVVMSAALVYARAFSFDDVALASVLFGG